LKCNTLTEVVANIRHW